MGMGPDDYRAQAQALRVQADDLEQRASQLQRAEQLRYQARQMEAQADAILAKYGPNTPPSIAQQPAAMSASLCGMPSSDQPSAESSQAPVESAAWDFSNPEHVARYVAAYYPPPATHEAIKNAA